MGISTLYIKYVRYFAKKIIYEWRYKVILGVTPKMKRMHLHSAKVIDVSKMLIFFIISHFKLFGALPLECRCHYLWWNSAYRFSNRFLKIAFQISNFQKNFCFHQWHFDEKVIFENNCHDLLFYTLWTPVLNLVLNPYLEKKFLHIL